MLNVVRAELVKLKRASLSLSTLAAVLFITGLSTSLLFLLVDSPEGNGREGIRISRETLELPTGLSLSFSNAAGLLGIVALCIFAAQTAQEYTYGTLRNLLVRQPSRMKVLIGKLIAMKLFALVVVISAGLVTFALSYLFAGVKDISTQSWGSSDARADIVRSFINVAIATVGYGIFGMILGLLFRSPISAISIGVIWNLIVEGLLSIFVTDLARYFPGQLLSTVALGGTEEISYQYALFTSYGFLAAGMVIVAILFKRRDVSN
jgi:ABC-type transport system involved in multi-copper enzyme maturation permease subunit